jgi:dTDP-glucose pyrophosphorylase
MEVQIVVLMAGRGSRVNAIGNGLPKPLIPIHDVSLAKIVTKNLSPKKFKAKFFYVCLEEHFNQFSLDQALGQLGVDCSLVPLSKITSGAAESALKAIPFLDMNKPLIVANSDQLFLKSIDEYLEFSFLDQSDASIMSMSASGNKWSYIRLNENGDVAEVREKVQISDIATVGIYFFKKCQYFKDAVDSMIDKEIRTNNEFYLAPCYNELISAGKTVTHFNVGTYGESVFGLGTDEDVKLFLERENSKHLIQTAIS